MCTGTPIQIWLFSCFSVLRGAGLCGTLLCGLGALGCGGTGRAGHFGNKIGFADVAVRQTVTIVPSAPIVTPESSAAINSPVKLRRPSWSLRVRIFARRPTKRRKCAGLVSGRFGPGDETSRACFSRMASQGAGDSFAEVKVDAVGMIDEQSDDVAVQLAEQQLDLRLCFGEPGFDFALELFDHCRPIPIRSSGCWICPPTKKKVSRGPLPDSAARADRSMRRFAKTDYI